MISIITINYNNVEGLRKTVASVLPQIHLLNEYIIVDGGSTDGSAEFLQELNHTSIQWVSEKDNGIYHAMNKGWRKSTSEFCLFLNSGDYLLHDRVIEQVKDVISKSSADIYFGDVGSETNGKFFIQKFVEYPTLYFLYYFYLPHPTSFISRKLLEEFEGYDESYSIIADKVFFIKAVLSSKSFHILNFPVTFFGAGGISSQGLPLHKEEQERIIQKEFPFLQHEYQNFRKLRHYEMSRPHQVLNFILKIFGKGFRK
jgi:glycosyltransferase involved in cell wall biosynthesis